MFAPRLRLLSVQVLLFYFGVSVPVLAGDDDDKPACQGLKPVHKDMKSEAKGDKELCPKFKKYEEDCGKKLKEASEDSYKRGDKSCKDTNGFKQKDCYTGSQEGSDRCGAGNNRDYAGVYGGAAKEKEGAAKDLRKKSKECKESREAAEKEKTEFFDDDGNKPCVANDTDSLKENEDAAKKQAEDLDKFAASDDQNRDTLMSQAKELDTEADKLASTGPAATTPSGGGSPSPSGGASSPSPASQAATSPTPSSNPPQQPQQQQQQPQQQQQAGGGQPSSPSTVTPPQSQASNGDGNPATSPAGTKGDPSKGVVSDNAGNGKGPAAGDNGGNSLNDAPVTDASKTKSSSARAPASAGSPGTIGSAFPDLRSSLAKGLGVASASAAGTSGGTAAVGGSAPGGSDAAASDAAKSADSSGSSSSSSSASSGGGGGGSSGGGGSAAQEEALNPFGKHLGDPKITLAGSDTDSAVKSLLGDLGGASAQAAEVDDTEDGIGETNGASLFDRAHGRLEILIRKGRIRGVAIR